MKRLVILLTVCLFYRSIANIHSSINNQPVDNFLFLSSAAADIIENCYFNLVQNIVLSGDISDEIVQSFHQLNKLINIINELEKDYQYDPVLLYNQPGLFSVVASTIQHLEDYLINLKKCPLWNIYQPFFILDKSTNENECRNAYGFLEISWRYNLLNVFFLCYQDGSVLIWTFNPFINHAPDPWRHQKLNRNFSTQLNLYHQQYNDYSSFNICKSLKWDKTQQIDGYKVKVVGLLDDEKCAADYSQTVGGVILDLFNVSVSTLCVPVEEVGIGNEAGGYTGMIGDLALGAYDISLTMFLVRYVKNITLTELNKMTYVKFIVLPKKDISTINKILQYLGYRFIIATAIVILVTLLILRYFVKQSIDSLFLEMVRLLANMAIIKLPTTLASKFFLVPVFFFYLLFQGIFQGNLSALLTISLPEKNLDTVEDLKAHRDYKIYVPALSVPFIDEELRDRLIIVPKIHCYNKVVNDTKAVCIGSTGILATIRDVEKFHMSTGSLYSSMIFYYTRKDWPIQKKFQQCVMTIIETGHPYTFLRESLKEYVHGSQKSLNDLIQDSGYSSLTLKHLAFAFQGLIIGHCIAVIVFLIEIKSWRILEKLFNYY